MTDFSGRGIVQPSSTERHGHACLPDGSGEGIEPFLME
jgi:hypothetical protein